MIGPVRKDTCRVSRRRGGRRGRKQQRRQRVVVGKPDRSLTGVSGMVAVAELDGKLAITTTLDARIASIKERDRGLSAGGLLVAQACAQLAGEDHLVGLDRRRAEVAGERLGPVATPPSTTAAGAGPRVRRRRAGRVGEGDRQGEGGGGGSGRAGARAAAAR